MIDTLENAIVNMKNGVYDFTKDGECSNCGGCCSSILPLSRKEIRDIERYIRKHKIQPYNHAKGSPLNKKPDFNFVCPFRDDIHRVCTIYSVRPFICRDFRCDKPRKQIEADRKLVLENRSVVNMWEFFK